MKANIASIWLVGIVIIFIMVFAAYIAITVDYSATFKMKNEVLNIIEKNKGLTNYDGSEIFSVVKKGTNTRVMSAVGSLRTINAFLAGSSYDGKGTCADLYDRSDSTPKKIKWIGVKSLDYNSKSDASNSYEVSQDNKSYYYCVARFKTGRTDNDWNESVYYQVQLFYRFEIPVLRELFPVRVDGTTDEVYKPSRHDILKTYENTELYDDYA